jgi:hypothetical protein
MKAIQNYMKKKLNIDPQSEQIGWFGNHEDSESLIWRFSYQGKNYRVTYHRKTKKVTSGPYVPPRPNLSLPGRSFF